MADGGKDFSQWSEAGTFAVKVYIIATAFLFIIAFIILGFAYTQAYSNVQTDDIANGAVTLPKLNETVLRTLPRYIGEHNRAVINDLGKRTAVVQRFLGAELGGPRGLYTLNFSGIEATSFAAKTTVKTPTQFSAIVYNYRSDTVATPRTYSPTYGGFQPIAIEPNTCIRYDEDVPDKISMVVLEFAIDTVGDAPTSVSLYSPPESSIRAAWEHTDTLFTLHNQPVAPMLSQDCAAHMVFQGTHWSSLVDYGGQLVQFYRDGESLPMDHSLATMSELLTPYNRLVRVGDFDLLVIQNATDTTTSRSTAAPYVHYVCANWATNVSVDEEIGIMLPAPIATARQLFDVIPTDTINSVLFASVEVGGVLFSHGTLDTATAKLMLSPSLVRLPVPLPDSDEHQGVPFIVSFTHRDEDTGQIDIVVGYRKLIVNDIGFVFVLYTLANGSNDFVRVITVYGTIGEATTDFAISGRPDAQLIISNRATGAAIIFNPAEAANITRSFAGTEVEQDVGARGGVGVGVVIDDGEPILVVGNRAAQNIDVSWPNRLSYWATDLQTAFT